MSVEEANRGIKSTAKYYRDTLGYTRVNYRCIHEGKFETRGCQQRQRSSNKIGCKAHFKLVASKEKDALVVTESFLEHNHELIPINACHYPEDRQANETEEADILTLRSLGVSAGKIASHLSITTGKILKRSDVHNIAAHNKERFSLVEDETWSLLQKMVNSDTDRQYSIVTNPDGHVEIIFFQTSSMRRYLQQYPHVLFIDGTYCINNLGYPIYVFMISDGDQKGHAVGYAIVKDERNATLSQVLVEFARNNNFDFDVVIVDKDAAEIAAIKTVLPQVKIVLCRFHSATTFQDAIAKYCKTPHEKSSAKTSLDKMLYGKSEEVFVEGFESLPPFLKVYVQKNWLPIKSSWAQHLTKLLKTYGSFTNNVTERHNQKLKTVSDHKTTLPSLISAVLAMHVAEERIQSQKMLEFKVKCRARRTLAKGPFLSQVRKIQEFLTPAGVTHLNAELEKATQYEEEAENTELFLEFLNCKNIRVSLHSCSCSCFLNLGLPCWHMMLLRLKSGLQMWDDEAIDKIWWLDTMYACTSCPLTTPDNASFVCIETENVSVRSEIQKRTYASDMLKTFLNTMVSCGEKVFKERCKAILTIENIWRNGQEVGEISVYLGGLGSSQEDRV